MNRGERRRAAFARTARRLLAHPIRKSPIVPVPRYVRRHMKQWPGMAARRARKERARVQRALDRRYR